MSKYPVKVSDGAVQETQKTALERVEPFSYLNSFFSFRISYTEMYSIDGKTHVKSKETRFENGKVTSQEFEGVGGPDLYNNAVVEAQNYFLNQTAFFLKQFSLFLPFSGKKSSHED